MDIEEKNRFIESWGSMGILWGINRSMARIHAFLLVSEEPVDAEEISNHLSISRGNTSMCLKELRNWGVVQRVNLSGDRRDFYITEPDAWRMLYRIALNRKSREFDPALHALRHLLAEADMQGSEKVHERLSQVEEILATLDHVISKFLESETRTRTMLDFIKTMAPK
ncbi:MAG: ArsR family transcriptional regulator [candidate division Zixibacteria bacterium]|nr:ArsR family transcriptional regulator [candidate division Zixibacteria bacterium]